MTRRQLKLIFNARVHSWPALSRRRCSISDFRIASSADEVTTAQCIILTAATKLRCDAGQLGLETLASVATILGANELVVRAIANELMHQNNAPVIGRDDGAHAGR